MYLYIYIYKFLNTPLAMVNLGSKVILAHFLHVPPASLAKNLQCAMLPWVQPDTIH